MSTDSWSFANKQKKCDIGVCDGHISSDTKEYSKSQILIEILLYLSLATRVFARPLGIVKFSYLSGTFILLCGIVCFIIIVVKKDHLPVSAAFAMAITAAALISDSFLLDVHVVVSRGSRDLIIWASLLLMSCYIVRNRSATLRFSIFLALCLMLALFMSSEFYGIAAGTSIQRLTIRKNTVGTMFANANAIAQIAYSLVAVLLFESLKTKALWRIICWISAVVLSSVVLLTLSRQGLILLCLGIILYFVASLKSLKGKIYLAIFAFLSLSVVLVYWNEVETIKESYEYRMKKVPSRRIEYFDTFFTDIYSTLVIGKGVENARTSKGYQPHNTFFWLHLAFGGVCAWIYICWLAWLMAKWVAIIRARGLDVSLKFETTTVFLLFFLSQLTGVFAPGNLGLILCTAVFERNVYFHTYKLQGALPV